MNDKIKLESLAPGEYFTCEALGGALMVVAPSMFGVSVGHIKVQTVHRKDMHEIEAQGFQIIVPQFLLVERKGHVNF